MRSIYDLAEHLVGLAESICGGEHDSSDEYAQHTGAGREFLQRAQDAGFVLLGDGYFSMVFKHVEQPGFAFKYSLKNQDMGLHYAAWCRSNPGKHVPQVQYLRKAKAGYCVVMPIYEAYDHRDPRQQAQYTAICNGLVRDKKLTEDYEQGLYDAGGWLALSAAKVAFAIGKYFRGLATVDMHPGNVLVDRYGQLVITDPLAQDQTWRAVINPDRSLPVVIVA